MRRLAPIEPLRAEGPAQNDPLTIPDESLDPATNGRSKNPRASHACESCRSLKVRCLSNTNPSTRKCQRCARLNQECLVKPRAPRKPRKRTDTRVGELEKQVEALRAAFGEFPVPNRSAGSAADSDKRSSSTNDQEHVFTPEAAANVNASPISSQDDICPLSPCGIIRRTLPQHATPSVGRPLSELLTRSIATDLFEKYKSELIQHFPLGLFSNAEDASLVQQRKPTLFLAVITAAAGDYDVELHSALHDQLAQDFAKRIFVDGEKSIELVQSLIIAAAFYHPPDAFEKLKYYQYIKKAWIMATDIGLGSIGSPATPSGPHESPSAYGEDETERNASRRTLIASYMSCLSVGRSLRRASMVQSESAAERCIETLQKSPYVTPRDHQLIAWVRLEVIMKEVTHLLGLSDMDLPADMADVRTQSTIKFFEARLENWKKELSPGVTYPSLEITYHYSIIYLHEIAFHHDGNFGDFQPPFRLRAPSKTAFNLPDLQTARLDCIITSMTAAHSLIEVLLRLPPQSLCVIPTVMYIRASYAVFILLRIFIISSAPGGELGHVLDPASIKIGYYLDCLVSHMQAATSGGNCKLTNRFSSIFSRSRDWFRRQTLRTGLENGAGDEDLFEPFRLLSLNDEVDASQCAVPEEMPDLQQRAAAQTYDLPSDNMNCISRYSTNQSGSSTADESKQPDRDALAFGTEIWQYPTPWGSQHITPNALQAESEPQLGSLYVDEHMQIPLSEADNVMDDSFDLALGFDFESHYWDFDLGNTSFEQT